MLEGNLATIAVEVHTAVGSGIAVSGQCVICAAGIIAGTLTGVCSEEHAASIHHFGSQLFEVTCLQDKMFRGVCVRETDGLVEIFHEYKGTVLQRLLCNRFSRQQLQLTVYFSLYVEQHLL